jgi:hypothetical protein
LGNEATLTKIVLKGMSAKITVNGGSYRNVMPPQPLFTNQQIADVLTYTGATRDSTG